MKLKPIQEKCITLKLTGFFQGLQLQELRTDSHELPFLERVSELLDVQLAEVECRRRKSLKRQANLRWANAHLSDIDLKSEQAIKPAVLKQLSTCDWIRYCQHAILEGPTGGGKTHFACALANEAINQGLSVRFYRYAELVLMLKSADSEGELDKLNRKLARIDLIVIDDWGIKALDAVSRHLLFEFIEYRDQKGSLLITSQYPVDKWHAAFQDPTVADSVLDRIVHCSHKIKLTFGSHRKRKGLRVSETQKSGGAS